jgi:histidine ammonia-lyase
MTHMPAADTAFLTLDGDSLGIAALARFAAGSTRLALSDAAWTRIGEARAVVDRIVEAGVPAYGITTGFGSQKDFAIDPRREADFNLRVLTGHATRAPGRKVPAHTARAALAVLLNGYARGWSGVRPALCEAQLGRANAGAAPDVRYGSSVGASDIVALSQLALPLVGRGSDGPGLDGHIAPPPLDGLAAKEAMSLLNSNALTLAAGALALAEAQRLLDALDLAAALSLEGFRGNPGAWSAVVEDAHPQPGHAASGRALRRLLQDSVLWQPGAPRLLQDPLSLRCAPQINGAARATLAWAWGVWERELNAVADNPLVDRATGAVVSHGSMETTLLSLSLDALRLAIAKAVEASGERVHKLQWPSFSGLPAGLAAESGASGGVQFLNLGHIAAAKGAAVRIAAQPVALHYRGQVCDGVEDVGGMAPFAVEEAERQLDAAWSAVAVEAAVAVWAIARRDLPVDGLGRGLRDPWRALRPLLPIGREGEAPFDLAPIEGWLRGWEMPAAA